MILCPFCGGISGYRTVYWTRYAQTTMWSGEEIEADPIDNKGGGIGECLDCGKRFNVSKTFDRESAGA